MSDEENKSETSDNPNPEIAQHDSIIDNSNIPDQTITFKKSTYNNMIRGAVVAIAIAAFFGGYLTGAMDDSTTNEDLLDAIEGIEITQPTPQAAHNLLRMLHPLHLN